MPRKPPARSARRTARPVRTAAARAVEHVLSSPDAFALLVRRLEEAGWHVEREAGAPRTPTVARSAPPPPARARQTTDRLTPPARTR